MINADFAQIVEFGSAGGAENQQAANTRKLHGGEADAAGGAVNEDAVARLHVSHDKHGVIGGEIVSWKSSRIFKAHTLRQAVGLIGGNGHPLGIGIGLDDGGDGVTRAKGYFVFGTVVFGYSLDDAGDFQPRDERRFGRVRIEAHALQEIGKVDADGANAHQDLARLDLRFGQLLQF